MYPYLFILLFNEVQSFLPMMFEMILYKIQIPIQVLSMFDLEMALHSKVIIHFGPSK